MTSNSIKGLLDPYELVADTFNALVFLSGLCVDGQEPNYQLRDEVCRVMQAVISKLQRISSPAVQDEHAVDLRFLFRDAATAND
jgi:hypothetical protein